MGKASVSNITVALGFVVVPKAVAMARLSFLASPFAILPPSLSRFFPLVPYYYFPFPGWHRTAHYRLAPYCSSLAGIPSNRWLHSPLYPPRSSYSSSVTPSGRIALPPWLPPTPWGARYNYLRDRWLRFDVGPLLDCFLLCAVTILSLRPAFRGLSETFFCSGKPAEGFGSLYLYVSMNCFLTCLGYSYLRWEARGAFPIVSGCLIFSMKR